MGRALFALAALCLVAPGCGHGHPRGTLVGTWIGHTRQLSIHADGTAREVVYDGCCHAIVDLTLRIASVRGPQLRAVATAEVVSIRHLDTPVLAENHIAAPHTGELDTLRLRGGVVTDGLTSVTFCRRSPPLPGSPCGA